MNRLLMILALLASTSTSTSTMADSKIPVIYNTNTQDYGTQHNGNFNQAANEQTLQTNTRAISSGSNASATTSTQQKLDTPANPSMNAMATIGGTSFINGNGALVDAQNTGATTRWPTLCASTSVLTRRASKITALINRTWR